MQLGYHFIDSAIIVVYLVATVAIGFWVAHRASKNLDSYFLGGKTMPWYILGVSNASGMFDITGTMWLVYIGFVYGLKSCWLPWLWPTFNQIILMVYLATWLRRSNVLTGAEWITTRFGTGRGATLSYISVVVFALISVVGFLAYEFKGIGKFASIFLPWDLTPNTYAVIMLSVTTIYVVKGGMFSVVLTELLQFAIMTIASFAVGIIAWLKVSPDTLAKVLPEGWKSLVFGWHLDLNWTGILDSANSKILADGYSLFTIFFIMMMFKGILVSMAGPAPNYDMQRILATRTPKEASLMSGFVNVVLFIPRYMMIAGLTVLALGYFLPELQAMGDKPDFELILPYAIKNFIPVGLKGVLMAGLLAAFMSTYAATVNAAPAYIVNDIYKRFINPNASDRTYVRLSYVASIGVVIVGITFGFFVDSIDTVMRWIVNALWAGYAASNILKWYWWRFNGYGFFWGMVSGIGAALIVPPIMSAWYPGLHEIYGFPPILAVSIIGSVLGSLLTEAEDDETLKKFYARIRPWGFWGPICEKVMKENPSFQKNGNFWRDWFNIGVGMVWQLCMMAFPFFLLIREMPGVVYTLLIIAIATLILKFNWYDKLEDDRIS